MSTDPGSPLCEPAPVQAATPVVEAAFLDALLQGDRRRCARLVAGRRDAGQSVVEIYEALLRPSLYAVGDLWEANRISVAAEHLATAVVDGLLAELYPLVLGAPRGGRRAVVASLEGELHHLGAKMVCDVLELHGWDSIYSGPDLPLADLLSLVDAHRPQLLGLSAGVDTHLSTLERTLEAVRARFPELPVLLGGQAFGRSGRGMEMAARHPGVCYLPTLGSLEAYLRRLPAPLPE